MSKKNRKLAMMLCATALTSFLSAQAQSDNASSELTIVAAGSLTQAMNEIICAYEAQGGPRFTVQYGPSGMLRQEIEAGKKVDVFASASTDHTEALEIKKLLGQSKVFTHNDLCVVARPELSLMENNLLDVIGRSTVRLATSTPIIDPMGDYTWQFFRNADKKLPGVYQILDGKALKFSGAIASAPGAKPPYVTAFEENKTDAYIMYCTNAVSTEKALPELITLRIPDELNVHSEYGNAAHPASFEGKRFVDFVLQPAGQIILKKYGFQ